jgi:hypothetical protein
VSSYRDTRIYGLQEIGELLRAVDRHLAVPARVVIIGGAAAAFHGAGSTTTDVDTHNTLDANLEEALQRAREDTKLDIPVGYSSVAEAPYNYEDRLEQRFPELEYLAVWVLEKHDLTLSKIIRGYEHDLQQVEEVHAESGLIFDVLVDRFRNEMDHVVGDPARILGNFLELIERLFGEMKRSEADRLIRA